MTNIDNSEIKINEKQSNELFTIEYKQKRREKKKIKKRKLDGESVLFIFENILEGWSTIRIFNTLIQKDDKGVVIGKKKVEQIATGNCCLFESEFENKERYEYYMELRKRVYEYHSK
jgi:hypothetical protein